MEMQDLFKQFDQIQEAFTEANKEFDCKNVEIVFQTDQGEMIPINCIKGGFAPNEDTHVLILSSGRKEMIEMLQQMMDSTPTVNADDFKTDDRIVPSNFESLFGDE